MENNELKNIWNALSENDLIDEKLAKENINRIVTSKGAGLFVKMKKKVLIDYWVYLIALIAVPIITTMVHLHLMKPLATIQAYVGITFVEVYLIYMFINARRKLKFIDYSNNNLSIKEGLISLQGRIKKAISHEFKLGIFFGIVFICFTIIQLIITGGGFTNIDFSKFSTMIVILLIVMLFVFPYALKYEFKIRYSDITEDITKTINELNPESK
ncbi:hypothetical protein EYV94_03210 [Puteibacter caeruleilacunae]|nr:hypothetical protein EYV94_03210 [Puteibacter caeruleilacunae]